LSGVIACLVLPVALGGVLFVWARNRWGPRGQAGCLLLFIVGLYLGMCGFTYGSVVSIGQTCGADDSYYQEWGLREAALWPLMFLTGKNLPEPPCELG